MFLLLFVELSLLINLRSCSLGLKGDLGFYIDYFIVFLILLPYIYKNSLWAWLRLVREWAIWRKP